MGAPLYAACLAVNVGMIIFCLANDLPGWALFNIVAAAWTTFWLVQAVA